MAYDKVVDSSILNGYFSDIADAIRGKLGTQETYTPAQMADAIESIPTSAVLTSIAVTKAPTKTTYNANQTFSKNGMEVTAYYSDGTSEVITGYTYSPTTALNASISEITISYTSKGVTKTTTQPITVNRLNPSLYLNNYDLGGQLPVGERGTINIGTTSNGAITAISGDSSKLTVYGISGKNIIVTKLISKGTVQLTVNIAQTNVYNAKSQVFTLNIEDFTVYDGNIAVSSINQTFEGTGDVCIVNFEGIYSVYEDGFPCSFSDVYAQGDLSEFVTYDPEEHFSLRLQDVDFFSDGNTERHITDTIVVSTKTNTKYINVDFTLHFNQW